MMKDISRKVAVFTGTRADYGILTPILRAIDAEASLHLQLLVSGTHFSAEFGNTYQQIEADGFAISGAVKLDFSDDSGQATAALMSQVMTGMSQHISVLQPDFLIILGDRYEALAMAQVALVMHVPVIHIHGGEVTEGAYDDAIRHAITKLSQYHITAAEPYRQRVIQLGEQPERVFTLGAPGLEVIREQTLSSRADTLQRLGLGANDTYALITLHSETQRAAASGDMMRSLLDAALSGGKLKLVCTYPNADEGGQAIIQVINEYAARYEERITVFKSLGQQGYLDAVKHSEMVLGNSSSAIIEVPSLGVPSVNIGQRQQGRLAADSVIHCPADTDSVREAIQRALTMDCHDIINPYGDGNVSGQLVTLIKQLPVECKKSFYDLPQQSGQL